MIKSGYRSINESLGEGILYHSTSTSAFIDIVRDGGKLKGFKPGYQWSDDKRAEITKKNVISFTRDKNFIFAPIRMTFSRSQIGNRYKLVPYDENAFDKDSKGNEKAAEEVGIINELDIYKYAKEIDLFKSTREPKAYDKIVKFLTEEIYDYMIRGEVIDLASSDVECACYLLYIIQTGMIKAGPNLKKIISKLPDYAYKYVDVYPFRSNGIPKLPNKAKDIANQITEIKNDVNKLFTNFEDNHSTINSKMLSIGKLKDEFIKSL